MFPYSTSGTDAICIGLREVLVMGLLGIDYAPRVHKDPNDYGPTIVFRFSNTDDPNAYHFVQPTLRTEEKRGVVCMQRAGTLTVFRATKFAHASTIHKSKPDRISPSLAIACVQKKRSLNVSDQRSDVLENMVNFCILERYYSPVADDNKKI
jgi:hypothetical protein